MWKCPKCGRSFSREGQDHYCGKIETVDQYIEEQDEKIRPYLNEVRQIIRSAIPEAQEKISWSMPTYWKGRNLIHFAASKKHLGLYPGGEATTVFADKLATAAERFDCRDCSVVLWAVCKMKPIKTRQHKPTRSFSIHYSISRTLEMNSFSVFTNVYGLYSPYVSVSETVRI